MSAAANYTPIIVGVGDVRNISTRVEDAREPADLMIKAIEKALQDTDLESIASLRRQIDSIDVVRTWTWAYADLPGLLAEKLEITAPLKHKLCTTNGGNQPAKILDEAARRIARGENRLAIITGGEALASGKSTYLLGDSITTGIDYLLQLPHVQNPISIRPLAGLPRTRIPKSSLLANLVNVMVCRQNVE